MEKDKDLCVVDGMQNLFVFGPGEVYFIASEGMSIDIKGYTCLDMEVLIHVRRICDVYNQRCKEIEAAYLQK